LDLLSRLPLTRPSDWNKAAVFLV